MGITGLARWINAPTTGLDLINDNIIRNHNCQFRAKWQLSVKSYRSMLGSIPGQSMTERTMCALTMNDNVFVLVDDAFAPTRADLAYHASQNPNTTPVEPPHYRNTFLTLSPPGALEQLLGLLRARWISTKQNATNPSQNRHGSQQQLTIDGNIFSIGTDWIVRAGNVVQNGNSVKGMLLEAEYLPVAAMSSEEASGLLSALLVSVLPNVRDAKTVAVTISDGQWEDVLWDREAEEKAKEEAEVEAEREKRRRGGGEDDLFVSEEEEREEEGGKRGDWVGIDRDRRSAYLIIGALKSEGLV
ncbi:hypothetical protein OF83DRAFT_486723 [Amylostereum chailletii]|nr:hypothetical protein OF83DRAFT_486723 [Amylostereum chailletii]